MEILIVLLVLAAAAYFLIRRRSGQTDAGGTEQPPIGVSAETPEWVRSFILYQVGYELQMARDGSSPKSVRALAMGVFDEQDQQWLLAALQNYLSYACQRDRRPGDYELVVKEARDFLQAELRTLNNPSAAKRFIRRSHKKETGSDISETDLATQFDQIAIGIKNDDEAGIKWRNLLLRDSVEEMFFARHSKHINTASGELVKHVKDALAR